MKIKKKLILLSSIAGAASIGIVILGLTIYVSLLYPEKTARENVLQFFKKSINTAVKYDDISISPFGSITLKNFSISVSSDFNDNVNIIQCKKAVADIGLIDMLLGKMVLSSITFNHTTMNIQKRYEKNYHDMLDLLYGHITSKEKIDNIDIHSLKVQFNDSIISYKEAIPNGKINVEFYDMDLSLSLDGKDLSFRASGNLKKLKNSVLPDGEIFAKGTINLVEATGKGRVEIDTVDLAYCNDFFVAYDIMPLALQGGGSVDVFFRKNKKTMAIKGRVDTTNLSLASTRQDHKQYLANENITLKFDGEWTTDFSVFRINQFKLYDDNAALRCSGDIDRNGVINVNYSIGEIDLTGMSHYITPIKGLKYGGVFSCKGKVFYDLKKNTDLGTEASGEFDALSADYYHNGKHTAMLSNTRGTLSVKDKKLVIKTQGMSDRSDFTLSWETTAKNFLPFQSETIIAIFSKNLQWKIPRAIGGYLLSIMFDEAYEDSRRGYEDIFFLQKPLGPFMNNNAVGFTIAADNLIMGKNAQFSKFKIATQLQSGIITLKEFTLDGYGGIFSGDVRAQFNCDNPFIAIKAGVRDLDMEYFYKDAAWGGTVTGKLALDFSYELSAYRFAHMLQNAKTTITASLGAGTIKETPLQKRVVAWLGKNAIAAEMSVLAVTQAGVTVSQIGETFYIQNATIASDALQCSGYGTATYSDGYMLNLNASVRSRDAFPLSIPLMLKGPLGSPCLHLSAKKDADPLCYK